MSQNKEIPAGIETTKDLSGELFCLLIAILRGMRARRVTKTIAKFSRKMRIIPETAGIRDRWVQYPNVKRWYTTIAKRPAVQKGYKVPKDVGEIPIP